MSTKNNEIPEMKNIESENTASTTNAKPLLDLDNDTSGPSTTRNASDVTNNDEKVNPILPYISPYNRTQTTKKTAATEKPQKVITIDSKEHFEQILKDAGDKFIVVEFYAAWCGSCKILEIKLEELAESYKDKVVMVKIDIEPLEELALEYEVTTMPAFMIMKNGEKLELFSGSKEELLENMLEKYLGKAKKDGSSN